jgi:hypothetical protein
MNDNSQPSLFDVYLQYVSNTEPPIIFHRWAFIGCVSALLGRNVWLPFGAVGRIFPNQFIMLIGDPGTRKSTAIKIASRLLAKTGYDKFAGNKTSKEKFLADLEGQDDAADPRVSSADAMTALLGSTVTDPREVFICADEFNDFMRAGDLEFHSMLGALWDWDNEETPYTYRLKNSKSISIYQPTVNLLGGNTHTNFAEMFPPQALGQGFLSRMISEPSRRKIAFPEPPDAGLEQVLLRRFAQIKAKIVGKMTLSPRAKEVITYLYNSYDPLDDIRFVSYSTRRYTHLLKLCVICAASRFSMEIDYCDVVEANSILSYAENFMPTALGEFGRSKNSAVQQKVLEFLRASREPIDIGDIWRQVSNELERSEDLQRLMTGLQQAGKVQYIKRVNPNAPFGFVALRPTVETTALHKNVSILPEYRDAR